MFIIIILIIGLVLFFQEELYLIYRIRVKRKSAFYRYEIKRDMEAIKNNKINLMLKATIGLNTKYNIPLFMLASFLVAFLVQLIMYKKIGLLMMLFISAMAFLLPYVILVVKLKISRIMKSNEGTVFVRELINAYGLTNNNMRAAIDYLAINMENAPNMKHVIIDLSKTLNFISDETYINECLDEFKYKVGSSWADMVALNMYFAIVKQVNVKEPLKDLLIVLDNSKIIKERLKRECNEGSIMISYVAPISYLLTVIAALGVFDFSLIKFLKYQFISGVGVKWFLIVVLTYVIGLLTKLYISDNKLDI